MSPQSPVHALRQRLGRLRRRIRTLLTLQGLARWIAAAASVLLLFYPHPRFSRVIAGKLFSYLGARRPILGVVPEGSDMEGLIQTAGDGRMVPDWNVAGIMARLQELLGEHREGALQAPRVPEEVVRSAREQRWISF